MRPLLLALLLLPVIATSAQDRTPADSSQVLEEIEVRDGSRFVGHVISEDATSLVLRTMGGLEVRLEKSQIVNRRAVEGRMRDGEFRRFDPNLTRLMFGPTGRSMPQGRGYIAAYYVVFGFVAYAPTDRLILAGGSLLIPAIFGDLIYVAPKYTVVKTDKGSGSVGLFAGKVDESTAGIIYTSWTRGQPDAAVTAGVGFGFGNGDFSADPLVMVGFEKSIGRSVKLVGEAYGLPTLAAGAIFIGGFRFYGDRMAADLGLIGVTDGGDMGTLPWVSFVYNFGK